jgi:hypothetical protein
VEDDAPTDDFERIRACTGRDARARLHAGID